MSLVDKKVNVFCFCLGYCIFLSFSFFLLKIMLRRKLFSSFKKQTSKFLSTASLPKVDATVQEEINLETPDVLSSPDYFKVHNLFTVKDLFNAKVHYGHKITSLTPLMRPYVFGSRLGHVIFDLDKTAEHLRTALNVTAHIAYRGGIILFVSKNPRITVLVEETAIESKEYAMTREWPLGTFTDSLHKFNCSVRLPDLVIILNTLEENNYEHQVIIEAAKMCIPTVAIVDSNCFPNLISYPIPGNDDSYSSIQLYCNLFKEAILRGKKMKEEHMKSCGKTEDKDTKDTSEESINVKTQDLMEIIKSH